MSQPLRPPTRRGGERRGRDGDGERARAAQVAAAVARAAAEAGVALGDDLLIWSLSGGRPAVPPVATTGDGDGSDGGDGDGGGPPGWDAAGVLGRALETATADDRRRAQGLHVTPRWLADHLVALAMTPATPAGPTTATAPIGAIATASAGAAVPVATALPGRPAVCDPACGGGAFLLAAARRLHGRGIGRREIVRDLLWGADVDPVGLAAAEAALALWAGEAPPAGRLVVADPLAAGRDAWPGVPPEGFDAVVGNPPFQSQLGRTTARSGSDQRRLRERFGPAVRAYTDTAWLFLLLGCELARPGGRLVLVQPQSVVAARDADAVRSAVGAAAVLRDLWVDGGRVFDAAVRVCAPVLERRPVRPPGEGAADCTSAARDTAVTSAGGAADDPWARLWSRAVDLPDVRLSHTRVLGERAAVLAGFRDQYYGLVGTVRELAPSEAAEAADAVAPLVTSGAVDWAACAWGRRPVRYAKRRWHAPVVDLDRLAGDAPPAARRWVERTRVAKLVVATQTRVVEAAVDVEGTWVPSVPALAVVPHDPDDLWRLAAAVLSPAASAWLARRGAGTGLDRGSLKVAGPDLAALPLPPDVCAWDAAATALERYVATPGADTLAAYLDAAARAYGTAAGITAWWRGLSGTAVRHHGSGG